MAPLSAPRKPTLTLGRWPSTSVLLSLFREGEAVYRFIALGFGLCSLGIQLSQRQCQHGQSPRLHRAIELDSITGMNWCLVVAVQWSLQQSFLNPKPYTLSPSSPLASSAAAAATSASQKAWMV